MLCAQYIWGMAKRLETWSQAELEVAVEAYVLMLRIQRAGLPLNKTAVRNAYLPLLRRKRSAKSWDFRMCNISALLVDLGLPYVKGFKPLRNVGENVRMEIRRALIQALI
jgi:5-methylcytosine-specific restriction protein A